MNAVDLPGGASAELRDAESLTGADQDKYADAVDAALEVRRREAEAAAIAANPAMMPDPSAPPPRARLTNADMRGLRDMVLGEMITAWSYPLAAALHQRFPFPVADLRLQRAAGGDLGARRRAQRRKRPKRGDHGWLRDYLLGRVLEPPPGGTSSVIRHARWICEGKVHPRGPQDIPAAVASWVDPVGYCLQAIRNGGGR